MMLDTVNEPVLKPVGEQVPPPLALMQMLFGKHLTYCLSAVARLGVADHMTAGPVHVEQLAADTDSHAPSLYRVMRCLASFDVFEEVPGKSFALKPMGDLLRTDSPNSLRYSAIQMGERWSTRAMEHFTDTVRTGEDGVTKAFGKNVFELFSESPEEAEVFNRSMTSFSSVLIDPIAASYDFSWIDRMADIGGGHGYLLASILKKNPLMRGVVYDLPEVISGAKGKPHFAGCEDRVGFEAGSFFERVPAGCDAYIMKFILHDWSDDYCRKILGLIREQLPPHGRVLVCEQVLDPAPVPSPGKLLDIEMLAMTVGGKERTAEEFSDLFASAGLRLARIVETGSPVCILEARLA
ncbi:MAG: methyltransferase [Bryobacteraceae bacterium]